MTYKDYYEYAKKEFTPETCEYCKKFSRCPEDTSNCEYCEVKIIQELVKTIDCLKIMLKYPITREIKDDEMQIDN